jgi:hypothetical protein
MHALPSVTIGEGVGGAIMAATFWYSSLPAQRLMLATETPRPQLAGGWCNEAQ